MMLVSRRLFADSTTRKQKRKEGGIKCETEIRLVTYVVAGTVVGAVDGPAAGSGGTTAAVVGTVDVLFEDSVFFRTVFILISSFFPTLFTLSSLPSAGVPPTLEAMSVNEQVRWPQTQRKYVVFSARGRGIGCDILFHIVQVRI